MKRLSRPELLADMAKMVPIQRFGKISEIADATVFLFSPAGDFVSGDVLVVDGGAWHRQGAAGSGLPYPESVMSSKVVEGVKGMKARGGSKL